MKRLFYLSGTLFFLSLTLLVGVHIGQQTATAQKTKAPEVATVIDDLNGPSLTNWVVTTDGATTAETAGHILWPGRSATPQTGWPA